MINIVQIGYGYWGTNVARNIMQSKATHMAALSDASQARLDAARTVYGPAIPDYTTDYEKYLSDPFSREAMIAEAAVQLMMNGAYVDVTDIRRSFTFDHWVKKVTEFAAQYGIR